MVSQTIKSINFVFQHVTQKGEFLFWLIIRLISAVLPLVSIYQFSHLIRLIESKSEISILLYYLLLIVIVRLVDNLLRLRSTTKLDYLISNIGFDVHNFFLIDFKPVSKEDRHASIQAIRNFAEAAVKTLTIFKQPGIDSAVSILFIPVALYLVDLRSFVLIITYIIVYSLINYYATQRYKALRDFQNTKTETYYAKLQENNDVDLEQATFTRHFKRLTDWTFVEWFALQNTAVIFYAIFLVYQIYLVVAGTSQISDIILIVGYVNQTQSFLNSFTEIWYGLEDMSVALQHLAKNQSVSAISLEDLVN